MTDSTKKTSTLERVLTALAELGPATAANIGKSTGIAYPTTTPKLRELENAGHAERIRTEQRTTLWQLTDTGKAAAAAVAACSTSTQTPSAASTDDDDQAGGESQQRANLRPEVEPELGAGVPAEDQVPGEPPADQQTRDSAAETDQPSPTPAEAAGPVGTAEQVAAPQAEPDPDPTPELETAPAPKTEPGASRSGATQDQPTREPRADDRIGESETESTEDIEHQGSGASTQERDGRRKPAQPRRRKGELRDEVLALLQRNPDTAYKVGEICKLINQAHDGTQVNPASAGAVANALDKLVIAGNVTRLDTKVATYQAD